MLSINKNLKRASLLLIFLGFTTLTVKAQEEASVDQLATPAKGLFNPFYFRAGLMTGMMTPWNAGPATATVGIRTEYGLSKIFSVVGDAQLNQGKSSFAGGQGTLAMRYMPFDLNKFQPYVGLGAGIGSMNKDMGGDGCRFPQAMPTFTTSTSPDEITSKEFKPHRLTGLAVFQLGVNFKFSSHFVAHAEAAYQTRISRRLDPGSMGFRVGMSYQFGK